MNKRIVIEIDEDIYQGIKESDFEFARNAVRSFQATIADAIRKGSPLESEVLKALEDVRAEIDTEYKRFRNKSDKWDERANGIGTALEIIDRKIAEVKEIRHDNS